MSFCVGDILKSISTAGSAQGLERMLTGLSELSTESSVTSQLVVQSIQISVSDEGTELGFKTIGCRAGVRVSVNG